MNERINDVKNIIVSTHDSLCPVKGGGALRTLRVAYEFKNRGHNVIIIAPVYGVRSLNGIEALPLRVPRKQRSQILSTIKFNIRLAIKLLRIIRNTDAIFVHNTIAAVFLPSFKKIFKFRFILDITDIHAEYLLIGKRNLFEKILTPCLLRYEYLIIRSADSITVASEAMRKLLVSKRISHDKIEVVYDSVDKGNIPQQKEREAEFGVIHLGAIDRQHGVEVIIQAIPTVIKEFPETRFFFVGGGRELPNIKKLAKKLEVINNCIFTDELPCEEARKFLQKATIGIIPRKDILPNRIITTLKIYEYWASRTAVISSPLQGVMEIASGNVNILWFQSADSGDLARKIKFLLKNKEFKEELIKEGLAAVNKLDFRVLASRIADYALLYQTETKA
jgi:glycosyltransferase involved in cell wall biosynthesis